VRYWYVPASDAAHTASLATHEPAAPPANRVLISATVVPVDELRVPDSARRLAGLLGGGVRVTYALAADWRTNDLIESVAVRFAGGYAMWINGYSEGVHRFGTSPPIIGLQAFEIERGWREPPAPPVEAFACGLCGVMDVKLTADRKRLYLHKHGKMPAWKCDGRKVKS
jgi:hypothetical protein